MEFAVRLEHAEDDRKVISELHRVLSATGWAILMVPVTARKTYEDRPDPRSPRARIAFRTARPCATLRARLCRPPSAGGDESVLLRP